MMKSRTDSNFCIDSVTVGVEVIRDVLMDIHDKAKRI
jgi:hypothetical protein